MVSEALDVAVGLQRREHDVHEPQAEEQGGGQDLGDSGPAQLAPDGGPAPVHEHGDADEGEDGEERDGEGQSPRVHLELLALRAVVDSGDGPGHTDSQEHVDGVAPGDVSDGGVGVLVLDGCHFTGKRV